MFTRWKVCCSLILGAAFLLPRTTHGQEVFELNFQSMYAGPHILNLEMYEPGVAQLKEESDGRLVLHYFMSGAIVKTEESLPALMNNTVDMIGVGPQYTDNYFPYTLAFQVPHITRESVHASALYWKAYTEIPEVREEWDKLIKVLTVWGSDRSGIFSTRGPILSPSDLNGKRVLVWGGGQIDQVKAWGGIPVQVSGNDTYMALQRGMGDVFFGPLPTGVAYKIMEVAKDITVIPANTLFLVNGMNWDVWEELPEDLQSLIMAKFGGEEASIKSGRMLYDATNRDIETMKAEGCTIHYLTDAQYQAFKDADRDVTMDFWNRDLKRLGNKDPEAFIKMVYEMAAATPGADD